MKIVIKLFLWILIGLWSYTCVWAKPSPKFLKVFEYWTKLDSYYLVYQYHYFGLLDSTGRQIVPCQYDDIDRFYEGMAEVVRDGKHGYINQKGKVIIPLIYTRANHFQNGEALVVTEEGDVGYLDKNGKPVKPFITTGRPYFSGKYTRGWVVQPYISDERESAGEFLQSNDGSIDYVPQETNFPQTLKKNGLNIIIIGDMDGAGFADSKGHIIVPLIYEDVDETYSWKDWVRVKKYGRFGFVDSQTGQLKIDFLYDDTQPSAYNVLWVKKDGKWGCINRQNNLIIPFQYTKVSPYVEQRAIVKLDNKLGYADSTGKLVIPLQYDKVSYYQQGQAKVYQGMKWQMLDTQGNILEQGFQNNTALKWVQHSAFFGGIILFLLYVRRKKISLFN